MDKKKITLGFSTCPNDTFIFHALVHRLVPCQGVVFQETLKDVEALNQDAIKGKYHVSKLSFSAIGRLLDTYGLLKSGAALGRGCGPLIVAGPGTTLDHLDSLTIAVPGLWTTACLLLSLYLPGKPRIVSMTFDQIMPAVQKGDIDAGVIIHEGRFTYENYGLNKLLDLGEWWEKTTSMPIPLGGIVARRDMEPEMAEEIQESIKNSVAYGFQNKDKSRPYIKNFAQEMSDQVIEQHIGLYVNDFTLDLGKEGEAAVERLFFMAREKGLMPQADSSLFISR